jgi:hypothetical protein
MKYTRGKILKGHVVSQVVIVDSVDENWGGTEIVIESCAICFIRNT